MGRLKSNGHRFVANDGDSSTLLQLANGVMEQIGRRGWVRRDAVSGRNLFSFEERAQL